MKANTNAAMASSDFDALNKALEKTATFAPAGYTNWASISKDGARAARQADLQAVKASCRGCHEQYKTKYRAEMRARPMP
jgi:cytochrome c556